MIYLDNAATSFPKPESVLRAVISCMSHYAGNPGRSGHALSRAASECVYETRCAVAELLGGEPEGVVFTKNATEAIALAIRSFVPEGGSVLISSFEHNSVFRTVKSLEKKGVRVYVFDVYPNRCDTLESFRRALSCTPSAVAVIHRSNVAPIILPIAEMGRLCKERGIPFVVDASQSAGVCKLDIEKIGASAICAPGHKSLYSPQGVGFALFSKSVSSDKVIPLYEGGSGSSSLSPYMPSDLPERAEAGTLPLISIAGLKEGIAFVKERGEENLFEYESKLISRLAYLLDSVRGIRVLGNEREKSNLLSFTVRNRDSEEISALLDKRGICTRAGLHCAPLAHNSLGSIEKGAVRISVGAFNKMSDISYCASAVRDILYCR